MHRSVLVALGVQVPANASTCTPKEHLGTNFTFRLFLRSRGPTWPTQSYCSSPLASRICLTLTSWTRHPKIQSRPHSSICGPLVLLTTLATLHLSVVR